MGFHLCRNSYRREIFITALLLFTIRSQYPYFRDKEELAWRGESVLSKLSLGAWLGNKFDVTNFYLPRECRNRDKQSL